MPKERKNKKMNEGKKNLVSLMIAKVITKGKSYINNDFIFSKKRFISKGHTRVSLKRKQGPVGAK